jgi:DNA invertase Pin-like site-specific DNA recombinase
LYARRVTGDERVVGYVRVSTLEQGASGSGLEAQREAIMTECGRRGWVVDRIEEDVLSGRSLKRPGLQRALHDCRTGTASGIVAAKLDRLSRSVIDFAGLLEDARRRGYNLVALDLGLDLSTPQGELVANVLASVAQWERRIIGERTRDALAVRRSQGVRLGRPRTMPDEVVARIRSLRKAGLSLSAIASALDADGVPTAQGGARWYASTVRAALS